MKLFIFTILISFLFVSCSNDDIKFEINNTDFNNFRIKKRTQCSTLEGNVDFIFFYNEKEVSKITYLTPFLEEMCKVCGILEYNNSTITNEQIMNFNGTLINVVKFIYTLENQKLKEIINYVSDMGGNFVIDSKDEFTYTSMGDIEFKITKAYDNGSFNLRQKVEYKYDDKGLIHQIIKSNYNNWDKDKQRTYTYLNDKVSEVTFSKYDPINNHLREVEKWKYIFNTDNKFKKIEVYNNSGDSWNKSEIEYIAIYDSNGNFTHYSGLENSYKLEYEEGEAANFETLYYAEYPKIKGLPKYANADIEY